MVSNRGYDSVSSKSRLRLIEAAAELLGEEGYRAVSVRRIANRAGLKPQLVHYYFRSMEDLVVAVYRQSVACYVQLHDNALSSPHPLRALWELNSNLPGGRRMTEYIALGKLYPKLREEIRRTSEHYRQMQSEAIERLFEKHRIENTWFDAETLATLIAALARNFTLENEVGMEMGHAGLRRMIGRLLDVVDPLDNAAEAAPAAGSD